MHFLKIALERNYDVCLSRPRRQPFQHFYLTKIFFLCIAGNKVFVYNITYDVILLFLSLVLKTIVHTQYEPHNMFLDVGRLSNAAAYILCYRSRCFKLSW